MFFGSTLSSACVIVICGALVTVRSQVVIGKLFEERRSIEDMMGFINDELNRRGSYDSVLFESVYRKDELITPFGVSYDNGRKKITKILFDCQRRQDLSTAAIISSIPAILEVVAMGGVLSFIEKVNKNVQDSVQGSVWENGIVDQMIDCSVKEFKGMCKDNRMFTFLVDFFTYLMRIRDRLDSVSNSLSRISVAERMISQNTLPNPNRANAGNALPASAPASNALPASAPASNASHASAPASSTLPAGTSNFAVTQPDGGAGAKTVVTTANTTATTSTVSGAPNTGVPSAVPSAKETQGQGQDATPLQNDAGAHTVAEGGDETKQQTQQNAPSPASSTQPGAGNGDAHAIAPQPVSNSAGGVKSGGGFSDAGSGALEFGQPLSRSMEGECVDSIAKCIVEIACICSEAVSSDAKKLRTLIAQAGFPTVCSDKPSSGDGYFADPMCDLTRYSAGIVSDAIAPGLYSAIVSSSGVTALVGASHGPGVNSVLNKNIVGSHPDHNFLVRCTYLFIDCVDRLVRRCYVDPEQIIKSSGELGAASRGGFDALSIFSDQSLFLSRVSRQEVPGS